MLDVLIIGTATRDVFLRSKHFKEFRDEDLKSIGIESGVAECFTWGGKLTVEKPILTTGGGATNAAVTFARQGMKTAALFKVGDDRPGEGVVREMKAEGVTSMALVDKELGTGYSTILLADTGERTILVYRGAASNFEEHEVPLKKLKAKWAYIAPGGIPLPVMENIVATLHKNGTKIAMNPSGAYVKMGRDKLASTLEKLSVVTLNKEEATTLTGGKPIHEFFVGIAVVSDGPRGVAVYSSGKEYVAGIYKEEKIVDRTGAGDAFGSGFVAGLMQKPDDIEHAIRLGSANATSVVEYVGAKEGILTTEQFKDERWKSFEISQKAL